MSESKIAIENTKHTIELSDYFHDIVGLFRAKAELRQHHIITIKEMLKNWKVVSYLNDIRMIES